jgi:hypothetical protein
VPAAVGGGTEEAAAGATNEGPAEPGGALDQPVLEEPTDD